MQKKIKLFEIGIFNLLVIKVLLNIIERDFFYFFWFNFKYFLFNFLIIHTKCSFNPKTLSVWSWKMPVCFTSLKNYEKTKTSKHLPPAWCWKKSWLVCYEKFWRELETKKHLFTPAHIHTYFNKMPHQHRGTKNVSKTFDPLC